MLSPGTNKRVDDRCQLIGAHYPLVGPWVHLHCTCTGLAQPGHACTASKDSQRQALQRSILHSVSFHCVAFVIPCTFCSNSTKSQEDSIWWTGSDRSNANFRIFCVYLPCWICTESTRTNVNRLKSVALHDSLIIRWRPRPRIREVKVRYSCLIFVSSTNISKNIETALLSIVNIPHIWFETPTVTLHHSVDSLHFVLLFFFSCFAAKIRARPYLDEHFKLFLRK